MNVLIIEDEMPAYKRLSKLVLECVPDASISGHLDSVQTATEWFKTHALPDLVFLDINLSDGTSFDLVRTVKIDCPIIFTTAYDQHAIEAFKTSSIDYLLKPVKKEDIVSALEKLTLLRDMFQQERPAAVAPVKTEYKKRFVIRFGEHIKTLPVSDIAYCFSENKATFARTFEGRTYPMDYNLDTLEQMFDPGNFFRINRQYLISLGAIDEMKMYSKARVIIKLNPAVKEPPVVSSERASYFKSWLDGEVI